MYTRCRSSGRGKCGAARSARGSMGTLFSEVCLLRVAAFGSVLQRVAVCVKSSMGTLLSEELPRGCCSVLPCVAACCHVLQCVSSTAWAHYLERYAFHVMSRHSYKEVVSRTVRLSEAVGGGGGVRAVAWGDVYVASDPGWRVCLLL